MKQSKQLPSSESLGFIEEIYSQYVKDPSSIGKDWRQYFEGLLNGDVLSRGFRTEPSFLPSSIFHTNGGVAAPSPSGQTSEAELQQRVGMLVRNYRVRGHKVSDVNPLPVPKPSLVELDPGYFGITEADMDRVVAADTLVGVGPIKVREVIQRLQNTYCRFIGVQFMHIDDLNVREWLQRRMEMTENRLAMSREEQLRILTRLTDAAMFEDFILKKFIGAKSFSLKGSESLIPLLELAIEKAGKQGILEIELAMAHRGRLNVLVNILNKSPQDIFRLFEDADAEYYKGRGDVKYHLGFSSTWTTQEGKEIHLSLCFNPSHLQYVNTVALGRMRAKQDRAGDTGREKGMALLIHGDAAFAGQGINQETLNLSELKNYSTGGTLHVITNNQLGFTTPPEEGRSTQYASDIAKMLQSPIFHVNGEDPEAVAQVVSMAMDFRHEFKRDVVIDMYGFRRYGHNETDEPSFTQPKMYEMIAKRRSVYEGYLEHMLALGGISRDEADSIASRQREYFEQELSKARSHDYEVRGEKLKGIWAPYIGGSAAHADWPETKLPKTRLTAILEAQTKLPDGFHLHPKLDRMMTQKLDMAAGKKPLDWAGAESLAFGSLAMEGYRVRLSGQDSGRGTFSQRHAILHDYETGDRYVPLQHLAPDQAPLEILNSPLSELGVLGFEYGYSLDYPDALVLWEAQFGDFVNAAQVIVDQFVTSSEIKWNRLTGLVMLLPHGLEGQGAEHSSCRIERFLELAEDDNIQIMNLTTPAQYFHGLRLQAIRKWRKPLIIATPKSLLRHPEAISSLDDLAKGGFQTVIADEEVKTAKAVLLCTGKVYYDLLHARKDRGRRDVAIVRLEQIYPFPEEVLSGVLARYGKTTPVVWVQEEPGNMAVYPCLRQKYCENLLGHPLSLVSRPNSPSPATGHASSHKLEQQILVDEALSI